MDITPPTAGMPEITHVVTALICGKFLPEPIAMCCQPPHHLRPGFRWKNASELVCDNSHPLPFFVLQRWPSVRSRFFEISKNMTQHMTTQLSRQALHGWFPEVEKLPDDDTWYSSWRSLGIQGWLNDSRYRTGLHPKNFIAIPSGDKLKTRYFQKSWLWFQKCKNLTFMQTQAHLRKQVSSGMSLAKFYSRRLSPEKPSQDEMSFAEISTFLELSWNFTLNISTTFNTVIQRYVKETWTMFKDCTNVLNVNDSQFLWLITFH